jgi:hypothetical protein
MGASGSETMPSAGHFMRFMTHSHRDVEGTEPHTIWRVSPPLVFPEPPLNPSDGPFRNYADWIRDSTSTEARAARVDINTWYAVFPDRDTMVLSRLREHKDVVVLQALDELYTHNLLSKSYEARYEDDERSPDFRLYRGSEYVAGIEVLTLFTEESFASMETRNSRLADEINKRVGSDLWYVGIDIIDWKRQPRYSDVARWLNETLAQIGPPTPNLARDEYPSAVYSSPGVDLAFEFIPRSNPSATGSGGIVGFGPGFALPVKPALRLRRNVSDKAGSTYDHRGRPYAVLVSVRDVSCANQDIIDALYGDDAISFPPGQPDLATSIRRNNGLFGRSASEPEGRNRRLSCLFALMRGWEPGSTVQPTIFRHDNPFAELAFPGDVLTSTS